MQESLEVRAEEGRERGGVAILGCIGGKGGQGASMFSAALSGLLSRERRTILVDLDFNSTHRHLLERDGSPGISNLAMVVEEISPLSLVNMVQRHPLGPEVLPGSKAPEEAAMLNGVNLELIFNLLADSYDCLVLDLPPDHRLLSTGVLARCSLVFLVIHPDLLSLRCALRTLDVCSRCSPGPIRWGLVVNGSGGGLIRPSQAAGVLEMPLLAVLPYDAAAGEGFSNLTGPWTGGGPYHSALEQMAMLMRLLEESTSTEPAGLAARCLNALKAWSGSRQEPGHPRVDLPRAGGRFPCPR